MPNPRLARLLKLMTVVRGRRSAPDVRALAAELKVSVRTVHRDVRDLELAGVPCRFDREARGYKIDGDFFLPPVQLTLSEAMALTVLASGLGRGKGAMPVVGAAAWQAVAKVRGQLPAALRDESAAADAYGAADANGAAGGGRDVDSGRDVGGGDGYVRVAGPRVSPQPGCERWFDLIRRAIDRRRKVRCVYAGGSGRSGGGRSADGRAGGGGRQPFLFQPYALYFGQRAWYAIGLHEGRAGSRAADGRVNPLGAERSLKLNRFESVEPTDQPYAVPDGWTVERCFGQAWRMIRGPRRHAVEVRFDAECGPNVADTLWHPTQTVEVEPDGRCTFRCEVDGLDEILYWVLGYGHRAEVVRPAELRAAVADSAGRVLAAYKQAGRPPVRRPAGARVLESV